MWIVDIDYVILFLKRYKIPYENIYLKELLSMNINCNTFFQMIEEIVDVERYDIGVYYKVLLTMKMYIHW